MTTVPGKSQFGTEYYVMTMKNQLGESFLHYVNLVCGEDDTADVYLNTMHLK